MQDGGRRELTGKQRLGIVKAASRVGASDRPVCGVVGSAAAAAEVDVAAEVAAVRVKLVGSRT